MKDKPDHAIYNTGGHTISLGELADLVREFLPDAQISFDNENRRPRAVWQFMIDNSGVLRKFGMQFRPYRERVLQIITKSAPKRARRRSTDAKLRPSEHPDSTPKPTFARTEERAIMIHRRRGQAPICLCPSIER